MYYTPLSRVQYSTENNFSITTPKTENCTIKYCILRSRLHDGRFRASSPTLDPRALEVPLRLAPELYTQYTVWELWPGSYQYQFVTSGTVPEYHTRLHCILSPFAIPRLHESRVHSLHLLGVPRGRRQIHILCPVKVVLVLTHLVRI